MSEYNCIVVLGPTASGKTRFACQIAHALNGEIISADSRQVYKHLNIGTGKDLNEYEIEDKKIPYHLIDLIEADKQFYLHDFIAGLNAAFIKITEKSKIPIICGGTGLYLDALRKDFSFTQIKEDTVLRETLELMSREDLIKKLENYPKENWKQVDLNSKKRIIRGIEIAEHFKKNSTTLQSIDLPFKPYYIGIKSNLEIRQQKINQRLQKRLEEGLIEEVESLLKSGISHERLRFFGLEYKFVSKFLMQEITRDQLQTYLYTAIVQFAKRQMTWFRKMEKEGVQIQWVESDSYNAQVAEKLKSIFE